MAKINISMYDENAAPPQKGGGENIDPRRIYVLDSGKPYRDGNR